MAHLVSRQDGNGILYDDALVHAPGPSLFEQSTWSGAPTAPGYSGGRGATLFIEHSGQQWVLRHYHRGGTIGRILDDQFIWLGEERTRCFSEWRLLAHLQTLGLPAPRPVAARYRRRGPGYTADLVTARIPDVEPLSDRLVRGPVALEVWAAVGRCIGEFHKAAVFHADLTAHNLQIDTSNRIFLLDFDRGRVRADSGNWREANLARLHRSLRKVSQDGRLALTSTQWRALLDGYAGPGPGA